MAKKLSLEEINSRLEELKTEARSLVDENGEVRSVDRFDAICAEVDELKQERAAAERRMNHLRELAGTSGHVEHGSSRGDGYHGEISVRDTAFRNIERDHKDGRLTDDGAKAVEALVNRGETAQRWAAVAGDPHYATAFAKMLMSERGHLEWTAEEHRAFQRSQIVQRAMAVGAPGTGGLLVPVHLDPAIILTSDGSVSALRQISRVVRTTGNEWNGVASEGATAEWIPEAQEVADGSPLLTQPNIPVHKYDVMVPFSVEAEGDAANLLSELQRVMADAVSGLHDEAYTLGSGNDEPTGIITALAAAAPSVVVPGGGSEALDAVDPYLLQNALGARYQSRAAFMAALPTLNALAQFETTNGALKFPGLQANPPRLLNRPVYENSLMDSAVNAGSTESNHLAVYGAFDNFVIVDRVGATVELVPHLFGANRRPTLQRGLILWGRTGSDVVNPNGFRLLNVPTAA